MRTRSDSVSIHPYFKVRAGKLEAFKALLPAFVDKTTPEPACLYYGFTVCGDIVHCREAYADADGLMAHLDSIAELLNQALAISDIERLEVHGPAAELEKLKELLGSLNPAWFAYETGLA